MGPQVRQLLSAARDGSGDFFDDVARVYGAADATHLRGKLSDLLTARAHELGGEVAAARLLNPLLLVACVLLDPADLKFVAFGFGKTRA